MIRQATETHQFLTWTDDTPYLVTYTPADAAATITFQTADDDIKDTWCDIPATFVFPTAAIAAIGLDRWAEDFAGYQHHLHLAEMACDSQAA